MDAAYPRLIHSSATAILSDSRAGTFLLSHAIWQFLNLFHQVFVLVDHFRSQAP